MKQVIVVNNSLKLPKGKLAAQVAHASVAAFIAADEKAKKAWIKIGMPKVVVKADTEDLLINLMTQAEEHGIPVCLIEDAGKTVVPEGTITCLGVGPAPEKDLDDLTGELKLL